MENTKHLLVALIHSKSCHGKEKSGSRKQKKGKSYHLENEAFLTRKVFVLAK